MRFYTDARWQEWSELERANYQLVNGRPIYKQKGYLHFDPKFWFPERASEIRKVVSSSSKFAQWEFYPFLQILTKTPRFRYDPKAGMPKRSVKERPICFAAHQDALIYGFCSHCITKEYETYIHAQGFANSVLAYRTDLDGDCNIQFAKQAFDYIRSLGECTAIALDISSFFDTLDHGLLKTCWLKIIGQQRLPEEDYKLYKTLTQFAYAEQEDLLSHLNVDLKKLKPRPRSLLDLFPDRNHAGFFRTLRRQGVICINRGVGIPQGSPMSAVLSNIYMVDFDQHVSQIANQMGFLYRRYCDDILLICPTELADQVKKDVYSKIKECKLIIQPRKEEEIQFRYDSKGKLRALNGKRLRNNPKRMKPGYEHYFYKPLQYLGFEFNGQSALIRNSSICRFLKKIKRRATKSVKMAYSRNSLSDKVFTQTTFRRYTHLGRRNFLTYVYKCAAQTYENTEGRVKQGMDSQKIRKQVAKHVHVLKSALQYKNHRRFEKKSARNKSVILKRV